MGQIDCYINLVEHTGVEPVSKQLYNDLTVNIFKIILLHEHRISVPLMPSIREGELPVPLSPFYLSLSYVPPSITLPRNII